MTSQYMTGREVIERSGITIFELFEYVRNGLIPYTNTGRIFNCPDKYNLVSQLAGIYRWITKLQNHDELNSNLSDWEYERVNAENGPAVFLHKLKQEKAEVYNKVKVLGKKDADETSWSWYYCDLPDFENEALKLLNDIADSYFLEDDCSTMLRIRKSCVLAKSID